MEHYISPLSSMAGAGLSDVKNTQGLLMDRTSHLFSLTWVGQGYICDEIHKDSSLSSPGWGEFM